MKYYFGRDIRVMTQLLRVLLESPGHLFQARDVSNFSPGKFPQLDKAFSIVSLRFDLRIWQVYRPVNHWARLLSINEELDLQLL